jgi:prophage DNA circulation protein
MIWRDQYQSATFRGVPFSVHESKTTGGRRVALHEYPQRNLPYAEDLGRKARGYELEALIVGADYFAGRDRLIAALEQRGPGLLIHPYLGRMQIQIQEFRLSESTAQGGIASFHLQFVEAGAATQPDATPDTAAAVDVKSSDTNTRLAEAFSSEFSGYKQPEFVLDDAAGIIGDVLDVVDAGRQTIATVAGEISSFMWRVQVLRAQVMRLVLAPADLADGLINTISGIRGLAASPLGALEVYRRLFRFGHDTPAIPATTPARRRQAANRAALVNLVRGSTVAAAAQSLADAQPYRYIGPASPLYSAGAGAAGTGVAAGSSVTARTIQINGRAVVLAVPDAPASTGGFATWQEAAAARDEVVDIIRAVMEEADDTVYPALRALSAAVVAHINVQRPALAYDGRYTAATTMPSLLLAYRIYGDATRADEIEYRNRVRHPGFVPGGVPIEVIQ